VTASRRAIAWLAVGAVPSLQPTRFDSRASNPAPRHRVRSVITQVGAEDSGHDDDILRRGT